MFRRIRKSHRIIAATAVLVLSTAGCGEKYEQVDYDAPVLVAFTEYQVPVAAPVEQPEQLPETTFAPPTPVGHALVFQGSIPGRGDGKKIRRVRVNLLRRAKSGNLVICASDGAFVRSDPDAELPFRLEIDDRVKPGEYVVEIINQDLYLARGKVTVSGS